MADTYQVGGTPGQITLTVSVGTAATCHSAIFKKDPAGVKTKAADSDPADNGSIPATSLGAASSLNGYEILIQSLADFGSTPASVASDIAKDINSLLKYLNITYTLDGGPSGPQKFTYAVTDCVVSTNGALASVVKHIALVP